VLSVDEPAMVKSEAALTTVVHLYNPGERVRPPRAPRRSSVRVSNEKVLVLRRLSLPLARLVKSGFTLPVALVKAFSMSETAKVSVEGVGAA
jgi:hypothetical protein